MDHRLAHCAEAKEPWISPSQKEALPPRRAPNDLIEIQILLFFTCEWNSAYISLCKNPHHHNQTDLTATRSPPGANTEVHSSQTHCPVFRPKNKTSQNGAGLIPPQPAGKQACCPPGFSTEETKHPVLFKPFECGDADSTLCSAQITSYYSCPLLCRQGLGKRPFYFQNMERP